MKISNFSKSEIVLGKLSRLKPVVLPILAGLLVGSLVFTLIYNCSGKKYENFAKKLVANDYPTLVCKSDSGKFRIYEQGTYSVAEQKAGWNVWWTDKGYSDATAFHVAKCDIKDELK